jgi:hypothetical protein
MRMTSVVLLSALLVASKASPGGDEFRARIDLFRAAASSDADVTGWVELRSGGGRERFQAEVEHLAAGATVEVLVADGLGAMIPAGPATADALGHAELELDTGDGASLPAGAASATELVGRAVEVRDGSGGLLLSGTAPALGGSGGTSRARLRASDDDSGVGVRVSMKIQRRLGRQEFRIDVRGLEDDAAVELWIDDGTGTLVLAGEMTASHRGRSRMRQQSRRGHSMPLGVLDLGDLSGRAFEVRSGGTTLLSGFLPEML